VDYLPAGDLTLTLTVNDADIDNEGRLTIGAWSQQLFLGQTGADQADHQVSYTVPANVIGDDCTISLTFEHLATAGYTVTEGSFEFAPTESCSIAPPTIVDPPVIFIE
jgi:hypothetical protein